MTALTVLPVRSKSPTVEMYPGGPLTPTQRYCNGCHAQLGDMDYRLDVPGYGAAAWFPGSMVTDVRGECPTCREEAP